MTVIKKLEMTSFGKFKDRVVEFTDGLNEIRLPNESGKSTMTDFILFVLYGFDHSAAKTVTAENNLQRRYLPWSGEGALNGAVELEADGRFVRVERNMSAGRKQTAVMRDASGAELARDGEPGQMLFGVDRDTFMRTFMVRQTDVKFSDTAGLAAALKNLVTTGDEDTSYEAAAEILRKKRMKFRSREKATGRIFDLRKQASELELTVARDSERLKEYGDLSEERDALAARLSETEKRCAELDAELPLARAGDARRTLEKVKKLQSELASLTVSDGTPPDAAELESMSRAFYDRDRAARDCENALTRLDGAINAERDALAACPDYELVKANEAEFSRIAELRDKPNIILIVTGAALAAAGIALSFALPVAGIPLAALGALGAVLGFVIKKKAPGGFGKDRQGLLDALQSYKSNGARIEAARGERASAESALEECRRVRENAEQSCAAITEKYGVSSPEEVTRLAERAASARAADRRRAELEAQLGALPSVPELEQTAAAGNSELTESEVKERLIDAMSLRTALGERLNALRERAAERDALEKRVFDGRAQKAELDKELAEGERQARILMAAEDALEQAYENISNRFSPIVNEAAGAPLSVLTGGKYSDVTLGRDFSIRVKADGAMRELGHFSRGTADAVYFAYRFAMCDLVSDRKGLPMILDDPFWSLDGDRLENARRLMQKAAADRQIILFSAR